MIVRNKNKTKWTFPPFPPSSSQAQLHTWHFNLLPLSGTEGWGLRLQSVYYISSLRLLPPHVPQGPSHRIVFDELLHHLSVLQGAVLREQTGPAWVCHGTSVSARSLLLCGLLIGCSFLQAISTCCGMGSSMGCGVPISSAAVYHGLQGDSLLHHGALHGQQGNFCYSASTSTPSPSAGFILT